MHADFEFSLLRGSKSQLLRSWHFYLTLHNLPKLSSICRLCLVFFFFIADDNYLISPKLEQSLRKPEYTQLKPVLTSQGPSAKFCYGAPFWPVAMQTFCRCLAVTPDTAVLRLQSSLYLNRQLHLPVWEQVDPWGINKECLLHRIFS